MNSIGIQHILRKFANTFNKFPIALICKLLRNLTTFWPRTKELTNNQNSSSRNNTLMKIFHSTCIFGESFNSNAKRGLSESKALTRFLLSRVILCRYKQLIRSRLTRLKKVWWRDDFWGDVDVALATVGHTNTLANT